MAGADRLPLGVVPSAYRLRIEPDLDAARFDGVVEIDVALDAPSATIELHALELSLPRAAARLEGGERRQAVVTLDPPTERAALTFEPGLPAGRAVLELAFAGTLNDQLAGFYRSTFTDLDGAAHTIATTQLCETDARRMFPCFDEPAFKATFEVTVVVPAPLRAFSNAPVQTTRTLEGGRREIAFRRTMPMSTYLVALVVGPFEQTAPVDVDGVPLTVVCTPGRTDLGGFALEVGAFALRFYAEYFGIPYPGEKVDLVAVPDFAYGAMENLGCITFRESVLLVDEQTASAAELQQVAMVVAHELAHMWFGDLVTMAWWEGIWLNEAFATQMQYLCADAFRPQWRLWGEFARDREFGLEIDALHTTRSIEFPVSSPADATGMLDAITYLKGATVLRMLEEFLGADVYRDGVRRYLEDHEYANAVTADLWRAFEAASGEPVAEVMGTWILQGGHPVVTAANGSLSQAPFAYRPPDGPSAIGRGWRVPVRSRPLAGGPAAAQLLGDEPEPVAAATPAVVNAGGLAAYRTAYDAETFGALVARLDALTELERGTLLGDTWALARAGARPVADVLAVARALDPVAEPRAWATVLGVLDLLDRIVDDRDRPQLQTGLRALRAAAHRLRLGRRARRGRADRDGPCDRGRGARGAGAGRLGASGGGGPVRGRRAHRRPRPRHRDRGGGDGRPRGGRGAPRAVPGRARPPGRGPVPDRARRPGRPRARARDARALLRVVPHPRRVVRDRQARREPRGRPVGVGGRGGVVGRHDRAHPAGAAVPRHDGRAVPRR